MMDVEIWLFDLEGDLELAILKNSMDPEIVSLVLQEVTVAQELTQFRNLTLKMTSHAVKHDNIELAVLQNPYIDPRLYLQLF